MDAISKRLARWLCAYPAALDKGLIWGRLTWDGCNLLAVLHLLAPPMLLIAAMPEGLASWLPLDDYGYLLLGVLLASLLGFGGFAVLLWSASKFRLAQEYAPDYVILPLLAVFVRVAGDYIGTMLILMAAIA